MIYQVTVLAPEFQANTVEGAIQGYIRENQAGGGLFDRVLIVWARCFPSDRWKQYEIVEVG